MDDLINDINQITTFYITRKEYFILYSKTHPSRSISILQFCCFTEDNDYQLA